MKRIYCLLMIILCLISLTAFRVTATENVNLDNLEDEIKNSLNDAIDGDVFDILKEIGIDSFDFDSIYNASLSGITEFFAETFTDKVRFCFGSFFELLSVVVLTGVITSLFKKDAEDNFINIFGVIILTLLCVNTISDTLSSVVSVLQMSGKFMLSFVPIYTLIISLSGNPAGALTYNTFIVAFAEFISYVITSGVTDMLGVFFSLSISFSLNSAINVSRLISALNKAFTFILGLMASLFSGILSIKSILSASIDSVSVKGIRFLLGSLIPVIGSSISDAYSSLIGSINIIKGSVAVIGILVVVIINTPIIFETLAYCISFNILSYLADSLSASRVGDILRCFSCGIRVLLLVCVFEMFILIISTGILLSVKNGG
ncbi:MAG: hypothetical protein J6Q79_08560 [Clostridia bacterium]|nr:hypothetical protein [Clostridia bacterium]